MNQIIDDINVVLLAGGVGGAKLADGLAQIVAPEKLTIIGNTGDDFRHLGLTICPDLDTVMYTLAGVANTKTGWGRASESWRVIENIGKLDGPDWFRLGDLDLSVHLTRTHWLQSGMTLTQVTEKLTKKLGMAPRLIPMCDAPAPTMIETDGEMLPFQEWFVQKRWQPIAKSIILPPDVRATSAASSAIQKADVVIIAPSNPYVSVAPILNCYPLRALLEDVPKSVVAVTPIIGGQAVKGPLAKMMADRGVEVSPWSVAAFYEGILTGFVADSVDEAAASTAQAEHPDLPVLFTNTWMKTSAERITLAQKVLAFALSTTRKKKS